MRVARTAVAGLLAIVAAGGLVACKGKTSPGSTTVVTVTPSDTSASAPSSTTSSGTTTRTSSSSTTPTGSPASGASTAVSSEPLQTSTRVAGPAPTNMTKLPGRCEKILTGDTVSAAIGHDFEGRTAFIVGQADADLGRVTYINCRYGASSSNSDTRQLEIQVSLYKTASQAAGRIPVVVKDFTDHDATATSTTVDAVSAKLLNGGSGQGYEPTVVLAYGQRTIAVTLSSKAVGAGVVDNDLLKLASLALRRTDPS